MKNIHRKINHNFKNSVFVTVFKNRRWDDWHCWVYDEVQHHHIRAEWYDKIMKKLNQQGFYKAGSEPKKIHL